MLPTSVQSHLDSILSSKLSLSGEHKLHLFNQRSHEERLVHNIDTLGGVSSTEVQLRCREVGFCRNGEEEGGRST